jgi:hypothetical protein
MWTPDVKTSHATTRFPVGDTLDELPFPASTRPAGNGSGGRSVALSRSCVGSAPTSANYRRWDRVCPRTPGPTAPPTEQTGACADCLAGNHDLSPDDWQTTFLWLLRRRCVCRDCVCPFRSVHIHEPRFDQRHHQPHVHRKRRNEPRHAA